MLDEFPNLKLLLAHTGGTLPFLAGRLDSCVSGDPHMQGRLKHLPSHYLKVRWRCAATVAVGVVLLLLLLALCCYCCCWRCAATVAVARL
jgi:hypothetical protein